MTTPKAKTQKAEARRLAVDPPRWDETRQRWVVGEACRCRRCREADLDESRRRDHPWDGF
jgi:hypothetical protein